VSKTLPINTALFSCGFYCGGWKIWKRGWRRVLTRCLFYYYYLRFYPEILPVRPKTLSNTLHPRQKFPYVRKPCSVSYEMQFPDGQANIGQHRPIVCPAFNLANFFKVWRPNLDSLGRYFLDTGDKFDIRTNTWYCCDHLIVSQPFDIAKYSRSWQGIHKWYGL
jgi:hypothetical protein